MNLRRWIRYVENWGPDGVLEAAAEDLQGQDLAQLKHTIEVWTREYNWVPDNHHKTMGGTWVEKLVRDRPPVICDGCGLEIPANQVKDVGRKRHYHDNGGACKQRAYRRRKRAAT